MNGASARRCIHSVDKMISTLKEFGVLCFVTNPENTASVKHKVTRDEISSFLVYTTLIWMIAVIILFKS